MMKRLAMLVLVAVLPLAACATQEAKEPHKVIIHVDDNDKAKMNIALNNAANVTSYYQDMGEEVMIEIVAYGPGLIMYMDNAKKNPVHKRVASFTDSFPNVGFRACGNTLKKMTKKAGGKAPKLIESAQVVPSGVVQLMSRQEEGWTYVRP